MKLVSFSINNQEYFGAGLDEGIKNLSNIDFSGTKHTSVRSLLKEGNISDEIKMYVSASKSPDFCYSDVNYLLPITKPGKIFCVGRNYRAYHEVVEDGRPDWPSIFPRFADSFSAHKQAIIQGKDDGDQLDYEGELVAVIGKNARHVNEEEALSYVAGYTVANEGSVRNWIGRGTQNCPVKNQWRSGSMGPWMVTADEINDPKNLEIQTEVNGETRQQGHTNMMIFDLPYIISYISRFTPLGPGDCICTGSPGGSAIEYDPPRYLKHGDMLKVSIDGIGTLKNDIAAES